jgi:protease IV
LYSLFFCRTYKKSEYSLVFFMKSRFLGCFTGLAVLILVVSIGLNAWFFSLWLGSDGAEEKEFSEKKVAAGGEGKIAHIDITGTIGNDEAASRGGGSMVDEAKAALQQAVDDRVDSPGGEVTASDTLYHAVKKADAAKPVVIYMDSVAASGGYYLSCGARRIVANENTWTGSIGVIMQSVGYAEAAGKLGVEMRTFRSGKFKDSLQGGRPLTAEDRGYLQGLVDQSYERFAKIVSDARKIPLDRLKAEIADGRVFSGVDALKYGLIDQTGLVEDAYILAKDLAKAPQAAVVRYGRHGGLGDLLHFQLGKAQQPGKLEISLPQGLVPRMKPGQCYLLPSHYLP